MKRDQSYKFRMMIGPSWASFLVPQTLISNPVTQRLNSDVNNTESAPFSRHFDFQTDSYSILIASKITLSLTDFAEIKIKNNSLRIKIL